jgi:hypothetical protein
MAETQERQAGLTFEQVWAAMMESDRKFQAMSQEADKRQQEFDKKFQESKAEHDRMIAESDRRQQEAERQTQETKQRIQEMSAEVEKTTQAVKELSKNVGGVNKSFGRLLEEMYSARLWDKFAGIGYDFTCGCQRKKFRENEQSIAEADLFLENGLYAMVVEVKTDLTTEDVNEHLERIATIRDYMDRHGDKRHLVGAVAGGIAPESVVRYAQKKGLYVVVWSGDAATIAEALSSFKAREWAAL